MPDGECRKCEKSSHEVSNYFFYYGRLESSSPTGGALVFNRYSVTCSPPVPICRGCIFARRVLLFLGGLLVLTATGWASWAFVYFVLRYDQSDDGGLAAVLAIIFFGGLWLAGLLIYKSFKSTEVIGDEMAIKLGFDGFNRYAYNAFFTRKKHSSPFG